MAAVSLRSLYSPLFIGAKRSKPMNRRLSLQSNFSSSLFPFVSPTIEDISTFESTIAIANRNRCVSRLSLSPLSAGFQPLSSVEGEDGQVSASEGHRSFVARAGEALSMAFPLWMSLSCFIALWNPPSFHWVSPTWQIVGLTLTMLGMGMTLTLDDLSAALLMPRELAAGFVLQYSVMPLSGYFVSKFLKLPSYFAAGLILVSCCPGGTASNIITYLARGNVALSVLMTAASTFAAAVMTPFLTSKLAGQFVAVDPIGLFISTVQVLLAPVLLGAILNQYFNNLIRYISPIMPFVAVTTVAILCGSAIAQNASAILNSGLQVVVAVFALHGSGYLFGYVLSKLLAVDDTSARTISIEVGMQNSVLGVVLAGQHFSNPLTAVPCAVSSIVQSIYGSALAGIWRSMPVETKVEHRQTETFSFPRKCR